MKFDNKSQELPGYFGDADGGNSIISGGEEAYDPHIYINAGEDIKKGQVVQVAKTTAMLTEENEETGETTEYEEAATVCLIQNSQRNDNNKTIGIAVEDCEAGSDCKILGNGLVFDYSDILEENGVEKWTKGKQLFCINNNAENMNVADKPNRKDNHIIKIGDLIDKTKVLIDIQEFVN